MIKYVELNYNEIITYKNVSNTGKSVLTGKLIVSCTFIRRQKSLKINELGVQFKKLQKEETTPPPNSLL